MKLSFILAMFCMVVAIIWFYFDKITALWFLGLSIFNYITCAIQKMEVSNDR